MYASSDITGIASGAKTQAKTLRELVDYAKQNPGKLSYGTSGAGTAQHLVGEMLNQFAKIDIVHVPYKGGSGALNDLIGGQIQVGFVVVPTVLEHVKAGRLRMLAVVDDKRYSELPAVPTQREALPGFSPKTSWLGVFGPAKLPPAIATRLSAELQKAAQDPQLSHYLNTNGMPVVGSTGEEFAKRLREAWPRVDRSTLGAAVLANSSWPLDRARLAALLGFSGITVNGYDATRRIREQPWGHTLPIVALTGQVSTKLIGSDAFQEADTFGITRSCTKHNWLVKDVNDLARTIHEAFYVATSGRPGPVLVDIPKNVQFAKGTYVGPKAIEHRTYHPRTEPQDKRIEEALALMAGAAQRRGRLARAVLIGEQRKHMARGVEHAGHVGHAGVEDEWLHGAVPVVLQTLPLKPARKRWGVDAGALRVSASGLTANCGERSTRYPRFPSKLPLAPIHQAPAAMIFEVLACSLCLVCHPGQLIQPAPAARLPGRRNAPPPSGRRPRETLLFETCAAAFAAPARRQASHPPRPAGANGFPWCATCHAALRFCQRRRPKT